MAFGVKRDELKAFQQKAESGEVALLTHYWLDKRFPNSKTVTKAASSDLEALKKWGSQYHLPEAYIDYGHKNLPHYDLFGEIQLKVLEQEGKWDQIERFHLRGEKND
ncbi:hypothetical protein MFLO_03215 [Listeria floridensis FSL S10-1187]|uniref:Uncharacterized protein n=1 Tax=Listeria floridensis FSL S10-1187 TaxID=1265817 RepID=A0ABN0RHF1_9LIST|nr:hypothetical protein [Listeria floridensis]EUJ33316.1 hypothetical protein MFLO_03215 [Listeria floridensis FSL S10-1187]